MELRAYAPTDCQQLYQLFYDTVHTVNARDYTPAQLDVWVTGNADLEQWNRSFLQHHTVVAVQDGILVGFGDVDSTGYLDRLYVHHQYQRQGIGTAICDVLEDMVTSRTITTHASITARPFFEKRGYGVVAEQQVQRQGICLTNYMMEKTL